MAIKSSNISNAFGLIIVCMAIVLSENKAYAHLNDVLNEVNYELRNTFRDVFTSFRRSHKPRWYHEHHRPYFYPSGYYPDFEPLPADETKPEMWEYPNISPKVEEYPKKPEAPSTITPSTTTSTTTSISTAIVTSPKLVVPRRRPGAPAFPRRDFDPKIINYEFSDKPGYCPVKPKGPWVCSSRCALDSDCRGEKKCCQNRCGAMACTSPTTYINDLNLNNEYIR